MRTITLLAATACIAGFTWNHHFGAKKHQSVPAKWLAYADTEIDDSGQRLFGMNRLKDEFMSRWDAHKQGEFQEPRFSRSGSFLGVRTGGKKTDAIISFDLHQPNPDELFIGTLGVLAPDYSPRYQAKSVRNHLPTVVDRKTAKIKIYVDGWRDYNEWLANYK